MNRDDIIQKLFGGRNPSASEATVIMANVVGAFAADCVARLATPIAMGRTWPELPTKETFDAVKKQLSVDVAAEIHKSMQSLEPGVARNMGELTLMAHVAVLEFFLDRTRGTLEALRAHPDLVTNPAMIRVEKDPDAD